MGFGDTANTPSAAEPPTAPPSPAGLPDPTPPQPAAPTNGATPAGEAAPASPPQGDITGEGQGQETPGGDPPAPPAWAEATDVDTVLGVESVAARVTELKTEATEEGRRAAQSQLQPILQGNQKRLEGILTNTGEFVKSWNKLIRAGTLTQQEATEIIEDNRGTFEALAGVQREAGAWEGRGEWIALAGKSDPAIVTEFQPRFDALRNGLDDPTFTQDFLAAIGKAAVTPLKKELTEANANIARLESEARTAGRTEQPAPAKTGGLGGPSAAAIGPDAILRSPTSTPEEKKAAFQEKHGIDIASVVPMN